MQKLTETLSKFVEKEKGYDPTFKLDDLFLADEEMDQELLCQFVLNELQNQIK